MKRNVLVIVLLCSVLMLLGSFSFAEVKNPDTIIYLDAGGPPTMDPHWSFDFASGQVIFQIYDGLINYKGESVTEYIPMLSTEVPSVENGLISEDGLTYIFPIRKGVKFHNGDILTPEDVVYSIKRALIFDRSGGPNFMLCEPLLGVSSVEDKTTEITGVENYSDLFVDGNPRGELKPNYNEAIVKVFTDYIDKTIEVDGDNVVFHLVQSYAPFLTILAHPNPCTNIIGKEWAIAQGAWDGKAGSWWKYHDPEIEKDPLYKIENGTGAFVLKKWIPEETVTLERFDDYWRGPAKIKNVQIKYIAEYTTRKLMLKNGDGDIANIPFQFINEMENMQGVTVTKNLPQLSSRMGMFVWDINAEGNSYIGSGKLDGEGIPPDFFSDIHVRKGFSYLFPYDLFITKVMKGMAIRVPGPIPKGIPAYTDDPALFYETSLLKAAEEFKLAWGGQLWEKGCKFNIFYSEGLEDRKGACDMLSAYANMLNPKFDLQPVGLQYSAYLQGALTGKLPLYIGGWNADYADPHNWVPPLMGAGGFYGNNFGEAYKKFAEKNVDPLLVKALKETNPEKRAAIYKELTQIAHDQAISLYLYQPVGCHVQRDWIKGWYHNPVVSGLPAGADFYSLSKGE